MWFQGSHEAYSFKSVSIMVTLCYPLIHIFLMRTSTRYRYFPMQYKLHIIGNSTKAWNCLALFVSRFLFATYKGNQSDFTFICHYTAPYFVELVFVPGLHPLIIAHHSAITLFVLANAYNLIDGVYSTYWKSIIILENRSCPSIFIIHFYLVFVYILPLRSRIRILVPVLNLSIISCAIMCFSNNLLIASTILEWVPEAYKKVDFYLYLVMVCFIIIRDHILFNLLVQSKRVLLLS